MKSVNKIIYADQEFYYAEPVPGYIYSILAHGEEIGNIQKILKRNSTINIDYFIKEETTVRDIQNVICNRMEEPVKEFCKSLQWIYIKTDQDLICVEELDIRMLDLLKQFNIKDELYLYMIFSAYQGDIWRDEQIRYYMPSHESGSHNNPHVHVIINRDYSAAIDIRTGEILAGRIPSKYKKKIVEKIMTNQTFLFECWNNMTDGLKVDIDYRFRNSEFKKDAL